MYTNGQIAVTAQARKFTPRLLVGAFVGVLVVRP
jgi:hypothetical protein